MICRRSNLLLVVLATACASEQTASYDIVETGGSGVAGTVTIDEIPGKSGLGEVRWAFEAMDPMTRPIVGFVHAGRCASLGMAVHPNAIENGAGAVQLHAGLDGLAVGGQTISAFAGDYAFAVHDSSMAADASGQTVGCADL